MTELPKRREQIYITRSHIFAISITTLSIAVLTFALGYKTGLSRAAPPPEIVSPPLLPNTEQQDTLEELLRQIEKTHEDSRSTDYLFPDEIDAPKLPMPEEEKIVEKTVSEIRPASDNAPANPKLSDIDVPNDGWAVQISSFPSEAEAQKTITSLKKKELAAYFVVANIEGKNWYRVRIGGYRTKEMAHKGRNELSVLLGGKDYIISKAP